MRKNNSASRKKGAGGGGGGTGLPRSFPSMLRASSNNILMKIRNVNLCFSPGDLHFFLSLVYHKTETASLI